MKINIIFTITQKINMGFLSNLMGNAGSVSPEKLNQEYQQILTDGEQIDAGFNVFRDVFMFTNKRLILIDKQGLTGKKIEYLSILYKSISRFSVETSGTFDLDAELKIWISSETIPSISKKFNKSVNVYEVQKLLANYLTK